MPFVTCQENSKVALIASRLRHGDFVWFCSGKNVEPVFFYRPTPGKPLSCVNAKIIGTVTRKELTQEYQHGLMESLREIAHFTDMRLVTITGAEVEGIKDTLHIFKK